MTIIFIKGQRVHHKHLGEGTFVENCWQDDTSLVSFDNDSHGEGQTLRVSTNLLSPHTKTVVNEVVKFENASIQVAEDPSEGIHSIALLTESGMEYKLISPELYDLLIKELTTQKGHIHEE